MKIYTQNVCCLPVGAHEKYLQKAGALGTVLALAATACERLMNRSPLQIS